MHKCYLRYGILFFLGLMCSCQFTPAEVGDQDVHVGFARKNITPPEGFRLCGSFHEKINRGLHDSLYVRAFVFGQESTTLALVGCDLAMLHPGIGERVKAEIRDLGIPDDHILLHASETHNGPDYFGEFREVFHRRSMQELGHDPAEPIDYEKYLVGQICAALRDAHDRMNPSEFTYGMGVCEGISFNRRFRMKDGSVAWNPGKLNPNISKPLGPVDTDVPVLSIYDTTDDHTPKAVLTGFAMHLAIIEDEHQYGADYPYYIDRTVDRAFSKDVFTHFLQSPCCEVNHINVSTSRPQSGFPYAEEVGRRLGKVVIDIAATATPRLDMHLNAAAASISMQLQEFDEQEVAAQREIWNAEDRSTMPFLDVVHAGKVTGIYDRHGGGPVEALIQVFQLTPQMALIGLPGEVGVELGLWLKKYSPYAHTMIVQLSNDWFGYIPNRRIFDEGQYEAVVAKIKPGEGERMVEFAAQLLVQLHEEK